MNRSSGAIDAIELSMVPNVRIPSCWHAPFFPKAPLGNPESSHDRLAERGQASVIVIGGGIVGCSILYHLAKTGRCDALLLERNELTSGATWHAAGNVHTQSAYPNLSALQAYSLRLYGGLAEEVGQEVGGFFLAQTRERMEEFKFLAGKFRALGIEYELVTPAEISSKHPLIETDDLVGGAWDPEEGYVHPCSVTMGLASGARRYGAKILRRKRVDRIERRRGGWRVYAGDEQWNCEIVVNAGGFWADEVAQIVGARLPITNMEHQYLVTDSMPEVAGRRQELPMIRDTDSARRRRTISVGLLSTPSEKHRPSVSWRHFRSNLAATGGARPIAGVRSRSFRAPILSAMPPRAAMDGGFDEAFALAGSTPRPPLPVRRSPCRFWANVALRQ